MSSSKKPLFGQVVIGAPGSGKSTYCNIMADFLRSQKRQVVIVNLGKSGREYYNIV